MYPNNKHIRDNWKSFADEIGGEFINVLDTYTVNYRIKKELTNGRLQMGIIDMMGIGHNSRTSLMTHISFHAKAPINGYLEIEHRSFLTWLGNLFNPKLKFEEDKLKATFSAVGRPSSEMNKVINSPELIQLLKEYPDLFIRYKDDLLYSSVSDFISDRVKLRIYLNGLNKIIEMVS